MASYLMQISMRVVQTQMIKNIADSIISPLCMMQFKIAKKKQTDCSTKQTTTSFLGILFIRQFIALQWIIGIILFLF